MIFGWVAWTWWRDCSGYGAPPSGSGHRHLLFPLQEALEGESDVGGADFVLARAISMVRMNRHILCFWVAKTCSTAERILERAALAF